MIKFASLFLFFFCSFFFLPSNSSSLLTANDGAAGDDLGWSISMDGDYLIAGAPYATILGNTNQGAAYIFYFNGNSWIQTQKLISSDGVANDNFGTSVSINGNYIVVSSGNSNNVYSFYYNGTFWNQHQEIQSYGSIISLYGNYLVIVSSSFSSFTIFINNGGTWNQPVSITPNTGNPNYPLYIIAILIYGNHIIVGGSNSSSNIQLAYAFFNNGGSWIQQQALVSVNTSTGLVSFSIYGNYMVVGVNGENIGTNSAQGAAYIFHYNGTSWIQTQKLTAYNGRAEDSFGNSVAIYGNYLVIGAYNSNSGAGGIYIYSFNGTLWTYQQEGTYPGSSQYGWAVSMNSNFCAVNLPSYNNFQGAISMVLISQVITTNQIPIQNTNQITTISIQITTSEITTNQITTSPNNQITTISNSGNTTETILGVTTSGINSTLGTSNMTNISLIIGAVVGAVLLLLILIIVIIILIIMKRRKKNQSKNSLSTTLNELPMHENEKPGNDPPKADTYDFVVLEQIGKGNFGEVYKGKLGFFDVACKKLNGTMSVEQPEIKVLKSLKHNHIVTFIGIKQFNGNSYIIMEFMNSGDLLNYIRNHPKLTEKELTEYAENICSGMEYLEENKIIHMDLALRNILCHNDGKLLICKVSDFGLSKVLPQNAYYYENSNNSAPIPIKWSAPELLFRDRFSHKSDVFSFGVVLFEIFSRGENPWVGKSNEEVIKLLRNRKRMEIPDNFPQFIVEMINSCWKEDPHERPNFFLLHSTLAEKAENAYEYVKTSLTDSTAYEHSVV